VSSDDSKAPDPLADVPRRRFPRHIAIIMDGNGRWARRRGKPRYHGHRQGARTVKRIVSECTRLGIEQLTLYSFSSENWSRPPREISLLMGLYRQQLIGERKLMMRQNVHFRMIGGRRRLPPAVVRELRETERLTRQNTGLTLCLAVNYGGRDEIVRAARRLARKVKAGSLEPRAIDEQAFSSELYTAGMSDPDLLIRTAGEMRLSNFLLWQISYAELHVTDVLWPDFAEADLHAAIREFAGRQRRFGRLPDGRAEPDGEDADAP
jgi:undecaprenyl diphosphate synthase